MNDPNIDNAPIEPSHGPTIAALDRLANAERSAPPEGFEARIAEATRPGVIAHIDEHRDRAHRQTSRVPLWWAVPIAAALAIAVVVLRPTTGPGPGTGPGSSPSGPIAMNATETTLVALESDLDDFLFIDGLAESVSVFDGVSSLEALESNQSTPADQLIFDLLTSDGSTL